jgi:hypothetical protein
MMVIPPGLEIDRIGLFHQDDVNAPFYLINTCKLGA